MADNVRAGELRRIGSPLTLGPTRSPCSWCRAPLELEELTYTGHELGERVYVCPACGRPNVLYSAAWLNLSTGGAH